MTLRTASSTLLEIVIVADQVVHDLPFVRDELTALAYRGPRLKLVHGAPIAQDVEHFEADHADAQFRSGRIADGGAGQQAKDEEGEGCL